MCKQFVILNAGPLARKFASHLLTTYARTETNGYGLLQTDGKNTHIERHLPVDTRGNFLSALYGRKYFGLGSPAVSKTMSGVIPRHPHAIIGHARKATGPIHIDYVHPASAGNVHLFHNGIVHSKGTWDTAELLQYYEENKVAEKPDNIDGIVDIGTFQACIVHAGPFVDVWRLSASLDWSYVRQVGLVIATTLAGIEGYKMTRPTAVEPFTMFRMGLDGSILSKHAIKPAPSVWTGPVSTAKTYTPAWGMDEDYTR